MAQTIVVRLRVEEVEGKTFAQMEAELMSQLREQLGPAVGAEVRAVAAGVARECVRAAGASGAGEDVSRESWWGCSARSSSNEIGRTVAAAEVVRPPTVLADSGEIR